MSLFRLGKKKLSLKFMHSSKGTDLFRAIKSKKKKARWAAYDSRHSRGMYGSWN